MQDAAGVEFQGNIVLARHVWIVFDEANQPVGLVDVEPYDDGTAGMAFGVAPHVRGRDVGQRILLALAEQEELKDVQTVVGGVEPENTAARIWLVKAGFTVAQVPDEEEMLNAEKKLH
jgi:ribosomal protein S18 acetylase RimI-like enzyme